MHAMTDFNITSKKFIRESMFGRQCRKNDLKLWCEWGISLQVYKTKQETHIQILGIKQNMQPEKLTPHNNS